jgi:hypothetical protein
MKQPTPTNTIAALSTLLLFLSGTSLILFLRLRQTEYRLTAKHIETGRLEDRVAQLESELQATQQRLTEERAVAASAVADAKQALQQEAAHALEGVQKPPTNAPSEPNIIRSLEEADTVARDLVARNDARGMLLLWEDLFAMGEPGFKKLCRLAGVLDLEGLMQTGPYGHSEFRRFLYERSEDLLRLGLFLDSQPSEDIPARVRSVFSLNDYGSSDLQELLGYYRGDDPEVLQGYTRKFRLRAEQELSDGGNIQEETLTSLTLIRTIESVDALVDLLTRVPEKRPVGVVGALVTQEDIVSALVWQGDPRAVPALYSLRDGTTDFDQRSRIDEAIQRLK